MDEDSKRWAIWIDIEGFSLLWSSGDRAIHGLNALMGGIYAIGNKAYPNDGERLFAHQFGDGFVIISDFHEDSLDRCASIAVTLMRHIVCSGCMARAAIAEGEFADVGGCRPAEIIFTSGGTEGDNLAIAGLTSPGDHIITSSIEHHAVLMTCKHLEETDRDVTFVPVDGRGLVDPDDVRRAILPNTKLISIMMANNETGVLQPVEEIGKIAAEADVHFHTDAVQAAGKIPIVVNRIGCDALSISGHKMHAPQGVGALYVRKATRLQPLFYGGRHERSRRAGTENVPGIVALGKAGFGACKARLGLPPFRIKPQYALRDREIVARIGEIAELRLRHAAPERRMRIDRQLAFRQ